MSSLDEEPAAPRDDPHAYGYPSPSATCRPDVSALVRNIDTSAQVPRFRNSVDREACDRQTAYAAQEPRRRNEALNRWWALFGVERNPTPQ